MHKGTSELISPACDACIPPLALQHKSQLVTFPGELWLESAKSTSLLLEDSEFYRGNCFSFNVRVFSSLLSLPTLPVQSQTAAQGTTLLVSPITVWFFSVQLAKVCLVVEWPRTRVRPG